jgi:protein-S-isoprenylcysteine O-methyltransferase Ste14
MSRWVLMESALKMWFQSGITGPPPVKLELFVKALVCWGAAVGFIVWCLFSLGSIASSIIRLPSTIDLNPAFRALGGALVVAGLALSLWLFRYRNPLNMIVSTYFTLVKLFTRAPASEVMGRTEPFVVGGPLKYTRNPLYLAAATIFLGWGLIMGVTSLLVGTLFVLAWFRFVQIPFEEKELHAIFGEQFSRYAAEVPMLVPFTNRRGRVAKQGRKRPDGGAREENA